jgi:hypothetical protein
MRKNTWGYRGVNVAYQPTALSQTQTGDGGDVRDVSQHAPVTRGNTGQSTRRRSRAYRSARGRSSPAR